jgi:hypothetical protein
VIFLIFVIVMISVNSVNCSCYARDGKSWFCRMIINHLQDFVCLGIEKLRSRPVRDDMLVENDGTNCLRPVGMQCW